MSGLEDSHIFTAEMQKKIRSAAYEEARPVFICSTARVRHCIFKLGFDDLLYHVKDVLLWLFYGSLGRMSFKSWYQQPACAQKTQKTQNNLPVCSILIRCDAISSSVTGYIQSSVRQLPSTVSTTTTKHGPGSHYTVIFKCTQNVLYHVTAPIHVHVVLIGLLKPAPRYNVVWFHVHDEISAPDGTGLHAQSPEHSIYHNLQFGTIVGFGFSCSAGGFLLCEYISCMLQFSLFRSAHLFFFFWRPCCAIIMAEQERKDLSDITGLSGPNVTSAG